MAFLNKQEIDLFGIKTPSADLKQTTGDGVEVGMSQKAITETFDAFGLFYRSYELRYGTMYVGQPSYVETDPLTICRFVTPELIKVKAGAKITFDNTSIYKFGYAFYTLEKVYDGIDRGWLTNGVTIEADGYIYLNFARKDDVQLTDDDKTAVQSICKVIINSIEDQIAAEHEKTNNLFEEFGFYYRDYDLVGGSFVGGAPAINNAANPTRYVTPNMIPVKAGVKINFTPNDVYKFGYAFYNAAKVYDGIDHGWNRETVTIEKDGYIYMNFGRIDEAAMSQSEIAVIKALCKVIYNPALETNSVDIVHDLKSSISVQYGRRHGASYVFVRIPKVTNRGYSVRPKLALTSADRTLTGSKVSPLTFAKREGTAFVINAGLFNMSNLQPVGQTIINGEAIVSEPMADDNGVPISDGECYPLCIDADGNLSAPYDRTITTDEMLDDGVAQSIVGWGKLVDNFEVCAEDIAAEIVHPSDYIRQSIGQFENGDYCVLTIEQSRGNVTNEAGMTYTEQAELLVEFGVKFAYSLDGGGSAGTVLGKRQLNRIYEGTAGRAVPTVIYFESYGHGEESNYENSLGKPIEISSAEELNLIISTATADDIGKIYKYVGATTDSYENGAYYVITESGNV